MQPDIVAAVVTFLLSQREVTALVGSHVYGAELPRDLPASGAGMPVQSIVIQAAPGAFGALRRSYVRAGHQRIDVRCYGDTPETAMQVYRAVHPVLKQAGQFVQGSTLIYSINQEIGAFTTREPDSRWPVTICSYDVFAAEEVMAAG